MKRTLLAIIWSAVMLFPIDAKNYLRATDSSFFTTAEAARIGDNILAYQRVTGGWPKNINMSDSLTAADLNKIKADKHRCDDSTIDNDATTPQIAYLARLFNTTGSQKYADAVNRGLQFLLNAQYSSGGWPQFWPDNRGYQKHITFNDNAMVNVMHLLSDIAESKQPFQSDKLISQKTRINCRKAFDKGIECILATQIIKNGRPTVWCQQHDSLTLAPAAARAYELPSFCSQESSAIVDLLMDIDNPGQRIINSVNGAMIWFEENRIDGMRVMRDNGQRAEWNTRLESDSTATPIWARFYDLDECRPFFCDRDGIPRRNLEEIGTERRNGYCWHMDWPAYTYSKYDQWADQNCPEDKAKLDFTNIPTAFPGAEGFGRFATGGRGGKVYHVTSLEDGDFQGTLRHAINAAGPRTIVFDVAGTIRLTSSLEITNGNLTIAGQTAPGLGICVGGQPVTLKADNVIIRYVRFRVGNECEGEPDGLQCTGSRNVIIDHCTISWSVDECCSVYGNENTTVQWCLISESLRNAGHRKGSHGYGAIWGGHRASFHHNLLAHHDSRAPRLGPHPTTQTRELVDMRNNVIYNWSGNGCYGAEGMKINLVNNYYKPGPATGDGIVRHRLMAPSVRTTRYCHHADGTPNIWHPMEHVWGKFYVDGNIIEGDDEVNGDNWSRGVYDHIRPDANDLTFTDSVRSDIRLNRPLNYGIVATHSATDAFDLVVADAGCSRQRDPIDSRIVNEVVSGTATKQGSVSKNAGDKPGIIDVPTDSWNVNGNPWPDLNPTREKALPDSDGDGMPDVWELTNGLNPHDAADGQLVRKGNGHYTNLEVYINSL